MEVSDGTAFGVIGLVLVLVVVFAVWDVHAAHSFAVHCHALGGHVKTVWIGKWAQSYCVTDHGVVDVR